MVIVLFFSLRSPAQQNNIWYFGTRSGIVFDPAPGALSPVALGNSSMIADEGCSSICDTSGNLLFYSNGVTIYNRNHQVMLNGDGLDGNISTVQSCIIVPAPGKPYLFYVFTADAIENAYQKGYRYSIVDMRADNGNGAVISKNILLYAPSTERLTATRHANGVDVWIITNDNLSNIFRSWLLDCNDLQASPVISVAGPVMNLYETMNVGALRTSPDGKLLCQTHFPDITVGGSPGNFFQLFDFDNATGIISNARSIAVPGVRYINCEYSPDSKLLYMTRPYDTVFEQFEPTLSTTAAITNSRIMITASKTIYGIQLGPDEKIYLAAPGPYLDVINKPNLKGVSCNYQAHQVPLINNAQLGFPSFVNDLAVDPYNNFTYQVLDSCSGAIQFNGLTNIGGTNIWSWDFGDGNTSNLQNPIHLFTPATQQYFVKLTISSSLQCGRKFLKSKIINPTGAVSSKAGFDILNVCDSGYVRFVNTSTFLQDFSGQFIWDFGDGNTSNAMYPIHTYAGAGSYDIKLKLKNNASCLDDSITRHLDLARFTIHTSPVQPILIGETVPLYVSGGGNKFQWTPTSWLSNPNIKNPVAMPLNDITYKVTATDNEGCKSEDSVFIKVMPLNDFYVPTAFTPNNDGKNDQIRPFFGAKFTLKEFSIFNRWGQKIFSTSERGVGWNGKVNNIIQNTGVYVWVINASDDAGVHYERKGSFVLIR